MTRETPSRLEPCRLERYGSVIADLLVDLKRAATTLGEKLHPTTAASLAGLVRLMNCYYSNLIEGHHTRPRDIQRALEGDLDEDEARRDLQAEAAAHVRLQAAIDARHAAGELGEPTSVDFIRWLHAELYRDVPERLLRVEGHGRSFVMKPGEMRSEPVHDVEVGRHVPPSSRVVAEFMRYFEAHFQLRNVGSAGRLLAIPIAHHRLVYIHPFPDGNGRVARLMSHAMALTAEIGAHGLWAVSRGLARGLEDRSEYKNMLAQADQERWNDLDGRGNLSHRALEAFVEWFLRVELDQVRFMSELFDLDHLSARLWDYVARTPALRPQATPLLAEILVRGKLPRGEAARASGLKERTARDLLSQLLSLGVLTSASPKAPVVLRFAPDSAEILFPRLFPPAASA